MSGRPFDLDDCIRQLIERERRPRRPRSRKPVQLPLFEIEPTIVPSLNRRHETNGLVVDDEMLFSRAISRHSIEKAFLARTYAEIVGKAMRNKPFPLWWVELFCGPGRLYVRDTGAYLPGSPLEALSITSPFRGYVFADLDPRCTESLGRRIGDRPDVHVLQGDANAAHILDKIAAIVPRNALLVLYGDMGGLDLEWQTNQFFIDRYHRLDLLVNLPTNGAVRAVAAGYDTKASRVLDHPAPRQLLPARGPKSPSFREWYHRQLAAQGFDKIESETIRIRGGTVELYDLLLASRNPLASKFFAAAVASFQRQRERVAS